MNEWMKSLSHVRLFATPWNVAYQAPLSMGFSRQEYWSGLPFPSPGDLPNPGIEPRSPSLWADALTSEPPGKPLLSIIWPSNSIPRSLSERTENTCPHKDLVLRTCLIFLLGTKRPQVFFTNYQSLAGPFKNRSISQRQKLRLCPKELKTHVYTKTYVEMGISKDKWELPGGPVVKTQRFHC